MHVHIWLLHNSWYECNQLHCKLLSLVLCINLSLSSYHQKYLLRQQNDVLSALGLTDKELITSHVAARLNGYVGGHGNVDSLEKELPDFKLPEKAQERIKRIVSRGSAW